MGKRPWGLHPDKGSHHPHAPHAASHLSETRFTVFTCAMTQEKPFSQNEMVNQVRVSSTGHGARTLFETAV